MESDAPVVRCAELQRWSETYTPGYAQMTEDAMSAVRKSPFTYDPKINEKIAYWTGELSLLDTHAVISCNNETLSDNDPQTSKLLERAGPELQQELRNSVRGCRTGEAKITKGYRLAARCVIHTVGPRYNAKYRTAAENALFNCYRNILLYFRESKLRSLGLRCIHSSRRGYPSLDGAHIGIRTVRRFLEKFGDDIDLIVFVVTGSDRDSYSSLLPLYFPRSPQEELYAAQRLPADVGSEDGEPVIAERKIRIAANPALSTSDEPEEDDDGADVDEDSISDILGTSLSIGQHAFSQMEADVDKQRRERRQDARLSMAAEQHRLHYDRLLKRASVENFADLNTRRFLYRSGFSKRGEQVVVLIGRNLPSSLSLADKVMLYAIHEMDSVVSNSYILVYIHTLVGAEGDMAEYCLKQLFTVTDNRYRKNLQKLYVLHTTVLSKLTLWWWTTFTASDIKAKVDYLPGVEYLFARITPDQLDLPDFVLKYDYETYGIRYYTSSDADL